MREPAHGVALPYRRILVPTDMSLAWERIIETAVTERADLIVMSTRGRDSLADRVIGSHAERVIRHAACPVLVV